MHIIKKVTSTAILAATALLLTAGIASAQSVVNLTAAQQSTLLPDGNSVPMWGWSCGTGAAAAVGATCTALTYTNGVPYSADRWRDLAAATDRRPLCGRRHQLDYQLDQHSASRDFAGDPRPVRVAAWERRFVRRGLEPMELMPARPQRPGPSSTPARSRHPRKVSACVPSYQKLPGSPPWARRRQWAFTPGLA